ncbi:MAG TPA: EamA family transporter RarD [Polyangiaceae bacterium]|nr:EamA family transporter RarD [Polyangiaceae bacterium]
MADSDLSRNGPDAAPSRSAGIGYALSAYALWGLLPLYIRAVHTVAPLELVSHRIVWAFSFLALVLVVTRRFEWLKTIQSRPRIIWSFLASAAVLSANWFVYIWAADAGRVVDASLGYFINPLLSVILAVLVLKERLRPLQWTAIGVAALGVLWLTLLAGQLPWIGLSLAISFGCYGLLRKTAQLEALAGLTLETTLLLPAASAYLIWVAPRDGSAWSTGSPELRALLVAAGPITAVPLLCFAAGARRIPLSLLGLLQYLGPSLQLLLGVAVFHEAFPFRKLVGFILIWLSLLLYTLEGWSVSRASAAAQRAQRT